MKHTGWETKFTNLFEHCLAEYKKGNENFTTYYSEDDLAFLASIGYKPREFFDFVEDYGDRGQPTPDTALRIASVRRDYFLTEQQGATSTREIRPADLPPKDAELEGYRWLPRILVKARGKLRGELDPDIMFSCGGDLGFLDRNNLDAAGFLSAVREAGEDDSKVVSYIRGARSRLV